MTATIEESCHVLTEGDEEFSRIDRESMLAFADKLESLPSGGANFKFPFVKSEVKSIAQLADIVNQLALRAGKGDQTVYLELQKDLMDLKGFLLPFLHERDKVIAALQKQVDTLNKTFEQLIIIIPKLLERFGDEQEVTLPSLPAQPTTKDIAPTPTPKRKKKKTKMVDSAPSPLPDLPLSTLPIQDATDKGSICAPSGKNPAASEVEKAVEGKETTVNNIVEGEPWKRVLRSSLNRKVKERVVEGNRIAQENSAFAPPRPNPSTKRDFLVSGFKREILEEDIKRVLAERGISKVNYVKVRNGTSAHPNRRFWTSARISIEQQDIALFQSPGFWETHFTVVPWVWAGDRRKSA